MRLVFGYTTFDDLNKKTVKTCWFYRFLMMRIRGLELPRVTALDPNADDTSVKIYISDDDVSENHKLISASLYFFEYEVRII